MDDVLDDVMDDVIVSDVTLTLSSKWMDCEGKLLTVLPSTAGDRSTLYNVMNL
jgi:hypothetical protein